MGISIKFLKQDIAGPSLVKVEFVSKHLGEVGYEGSDVLRRAQGSYSEMWFMST